ncbi:hypothetical protein R1sor_025699 [Riccia sorocarpa]|uniref:DUF4283 domain-containing protein n=1 Tax=Riccia sorocarpa TaxID=122646 RepID=A0ABD3GAV7_9MARC
MANFGGNMTVIGGGSVGSGNGAIASSTGGSPSGALHSIDNVGKVIFTNLCFKPGEDFSKAPKSSCNVMNDHGNGDKSTVGRQQIDDLEVFPPLCKTIKSVTPEPAEEKAHGMMHKDPQTTLKAVTQKSLLERHHGWASTHKTVEEPNPYIRGLKLEEGHNVTTTKLQEVVQDVNSYVNIEEYSIGNTIEVERSFFASRLRHLQNCAFVLCALDGAPSKDKVTEWAREEMWQKRGIQVEQIRILARGCYLVVTGSAEQQHKALIKRPYKLNGRMIFAFPWNPKFSPRELRTKLVPIWVDLPKVHPLLEAYGAAMLDLVFRGHACRFVIRPLSQQGFTWVTRYMYLCALAKKAKVVEKKKDETLKKVEKKKKETTEEKKADDPTKEKEKKTSEVPPLPANQRTKRPRFLEIDDIWIDPEIITGMTVDTKGKSKANEEEEHDPTPEDPKDSPAKPSGSGKPAPPYGDLPTKFEKFCSQFGSQRSEGIPDMFSDPESVQKIQFATSLLADITQQTNNFDCGIHVLYIITKLIEAGKNGQLLEYLENGGLPKEWSTDEIVSKYRLEVRELLISLVESDT